MARKTLRGRSYPDLLEELPCAVLPLALRKLRVEAQRFGQLPANRLDGVQRGMRVLVDHPDLVAAHARQFALARRHEIATEQAYRAATDPDPGREQAHD